LRGSITEFQASFALPPIEPSVADFFAIVGGEDFYGAAHFVEAGADAADCGPTMGRPSRFR